jgi:hypothetical protein
MSSKTLDDAHHLFFQDYKFGLEDRAFLEYIAYHLYDGASKSKPVTETIRESLRNLTAHPGFTAQYGLLVNKVAGSPSEAKAGHDVPTWQHVNEHISLTGQSGLTYATISMCNGPKPDNGRKGETFPPLS